MPCRPEEEFAQCSDDSDADLRRTPRRRRMFETELSDAEESNSYSNSDAEIQSKKGDVQGVSSTENQRICSLSITASVTMSEIFKIYAELMPVSR